MGSGISRKRAKTAAGSAAGFGEHAAVDPGIRELLDFSKPYLYCRMYRATMPVDTCLVRRLARLSGSNRFTEEGGLDPGCAKCDQGEAVARWAVEQKAMMEDKAMKGKKKTKKTGKCVNCGREGRVIKSRGCCANCYDTPIRKGYKWGSQECIALLAEIRERMDPLFQAVEDRDSEKAPAPASQYRRSLDQRSEKKKKPITWSEEIGNVVDAGLAPDLIRAAEGGGTDAKCQEDLAAIEPGTKEGFKVLFEESPGPTGEGQESMVPKRVSSGIQFPPGEGPGQPAETTRCDRYISLFFASEESSDRNLYDWLRSRAAVNRRGKAAEVLSILESMINKEERRKEAEKAFRDYTTRSQRLQENIAKEKYFVHTPDGQTIPAKGLTSNDKLKLGLVIGFIFGVMAFLMMYLAVRLL